MNTHTLLMITQVIVNKKSYHFEGEVGRGYGEEFEK